MQAVGVVGTISPRFSAAQSHSLFCEYFPCTAPELPILERKNWLIYLLYVRRDYEECKVRAASRMWEWFHWCRDKTVFLTVSQPPSFLTSFGINGPRENLSKMTSVLSSPWLPSGCEGAALWSSVWAQDLTGRGKVQRAADLCCSKWWTGFSKLIITQFHSAGFLMVLQGHYENTSVEGNIANKCK